jgi:hypothetical protein
MSPPRAYSVLLMSSIFKKRRNEFLDKAGGQASVASSLEFKVKEVANQYSAAPRTPFTVEDIANRFVYWLFTIFLAVSPLSTQS